MNPHSRVARAGVLLVSHGSKSPVWRRMLLDIEDEIRDTVQAVPGVAKIRSAFMEYAEPSIATQLKRFDEDGVNRVILVPMLLTISGHSFDDIPVICGLKSDPAVEARLAAEQIARYASRADVAITPLLDYPNIVRQNIARRIAQARAERPATGPTRDGVVLVGYGSAEFGGEWESFFGGIARYAVRELGMAAAEYAWCGHVVHYAREPTLEAIRRVLATADRAVVLPLLVAYDEMFQHGIIAGAIEAANAADRILYRADAILPEPAVGHWVIEAVCREALRAPARPKIWKEPHLETEGVRL